MKVIMKNIFKSESVSKFQKMLEESDKIVLTAHMRPDGDALGSTLGLWHLLKRWGRPLP